MTYNLNLNQVKMMEWGLSIKAGLIMCKMTTLSTWAKPFVKDGEIYYYLVRTKILEEIPILGKSLPTISKALSELFDLALIDRINEHTIPAYRLTEKGNEWISDTKKSNDAEISPEKKTKDNLSLSVEVMLEDVSDEYKKDFHVRCYTYCEEKNIDKNELETFVNWHISKGTTYKNWFRAFVTWHKRSKNNTQHKPNSKNNTRGNLSGTGDNF